MISLSPVNLYYTRLYLLRLLTYIAPSAHYLVHRTQFTAPVGLALAHLQIFSRAVS